MFRCELWWVATGMSIYCRCTACFAVNNIVQKCLATELAGSVFHFQSWVQASECGSFESAVRV
jgi:hypothetical protein